MEIGPLARTYVKLFWHLNKDIFIKVLLLSFVGKDGLSGRDGVKVSTRKNVRYKLPTWNSRNQVTSTWIRRVDTQMRLTPPLLIFLPFLHRKLSSFIFLLGLIYLSARALYSRRVTKEIKEEMARKANQEYAI